MIYPVPLLILQLSKSTLYAWMTHGLYLNQINVSATSDRSSAQPLEWQMSKVHLFSLLSFSFSLQTVFNERSAAEGCCSDDCCGILLVKKKREKPAHPAPSPRQTNCKCVWLLSLDEKNMWLGLLVVYFLPLTFVAVAVYWGWGCVGEHNASDLYIPHCHHSSQAPFLECLEGEKGGQEHHLEFALPYNNLLL